MPLWLTILCSTGIAGLVIKDIYIAIKNGGKKAKALLKKQKQDEMREVIKEEIEPIEKRMTNIEINTEYSVSADVLALRCNMKALRDRVKKQGYADIGDKVTMRELYNKYAQLGGNHFSEYVDKWFDDVDLLPEEHSEEIL